MPPLQRLNLALRALMEIGVVAALGYWGFQTGGSTTTKILLGLGAPVVGFGFWGAVDFHQAGRLAEPLRLLQELALSGLAAFAWYGAGQHALGLALALLSIVYHALVYASGSRLLHPRMPAGGMRRRSSRAGLDNGAACGESMLLRLAEREDAPEGLGQAGERHAEITSFRCA